MSYQHPHDSVPGYEPPVRQRSEMPTYNLAPAPQPVVVNVVQQNAGPSAFVVRRPVNHKLHAWLTLLTGGAWAFVWIPLAIRGKKTIVRAIR